MLVVIDTNILVSSRLSPNGNEGQVLYLFQQSLIEIATTPQIIDEYKRVFQYLHIQKRLKWSKNKMDQYLYNFTLATTLFPGQTVVNVIKNDPDDDKFLACALEAKANYIISGDQHLLKIKKFQKIPIVTAKKFCCLSTNFSINKKSSD
ncbi:MAG: putative toxin-antitoxin system toxin component, PIN family [Patescibacteria group bacterium]